MNITNILTACAIAVLTVAVVILTVKTKVIEEEMDDFEEDKANDDRVNEISKDLDRVELQVVKWNDEMDNVIKRLEEITADIGRLDETSKRDHSDLVDIRERYVLWREEKDESVSDE